MDNAILREIRERANKAEQLLFTIDKIKEYEKYLKDNRTKVSRIDFMYKKEIERGYGSDAYTENQNVLETLSQSNLGITLDEFNEAFYGAIVSAFEQLKLNYIKQYDEL